MSVATEYNFDGLAGPSHHFGGLATGNLASLSNAGHVSKPKAAALASIAKMRLLLQLGVPQAILPPQVRPNLAMLRNLGFTGSDVTVISKAAKFPEILACAYSCAYMWSANAATVSPSAHTSDNKLHITPANLVMHLHRSIEASWNYKMLQSIFADPNYFVVHEPLMATFELSDEGAANHSYICSDYGRAGCELYVYGREHTLELTKSKFVPRQTLAASTACARVHSCADELQVFAKQNPIAIAKGVFHNDVAFVANKNVLLYHVDAFVNTKEVITKIKKCVPQELFLIEITEDMLSLEEAVASYLFNSQLVSVDNDMLLIAPEECTADPKVRKLIATIIDKENPISDVHFVNCRESMQNGGGPACLRLRVVLTAAEAAAMSQEVIVTEELLNRLEAWVQSNYREELMLKDLADPLLLQECHDAFLRLVDIFPTLTLVGK